MKRAHWQNNEEGTGALYLSITNNFLLSLNDIVAEWLRRWPAKSMGYARAGSNPVNVVFHLR